MAHRLLFNGSFFFGEGSFEAASMEAARRDLRKALLVADPNVAALPLFVTLQESFRQRGVAFALFRDIPQNPDIACVHRALHAYRAAGADHIVAVGGGSTLDTAKAVSLIANNPKHKDVASLGAWPVTKNRGVPLIAMPTTAGTGSEANMNFVITDPAAGKKIVCSDPNAIPEVAVIDPLFMQSMPASLTAATGMDALAHAVESYLALGAWAMTDTLNLKAMELIGRGLRSAVEGNRFALADVALGQYMTGMVFAGAGLGLAHGMSHAVGGMYDIPHGLTTAVILPYALAFNAPVAGKKYRSMAEAMGVKNVNAMNEEGAAKAAVYAVRKLASDVNIPDKLQLLDVRPEDLPKLAETALADVATRGNPRPCTRELIFEVFKAAY